MAEQRSKSRLSEKLRHHEQLPFDAIASAERFMPQQPENRLCSFACHAKLSARRSRCLVGSWDADAACGRTGQAEPEAHAYPQSASAGGGRLGHGHETTVAAAGHWRQIAICLQCSVSKRIARLRPAMKHLLTWMRRNADTTGHRYRWCLRPVFAGRKRFFSSPPCERSISLVAVVTLCRPACRSLGRCRCARGLWRLGLRAHLAGRLELLARHAGAGP